MAVDHAALESHWQFLKDRTANDLFAAFDAATASLHRKFEKEGTKRSEVENFLEISTLFISEGKQEEEKSLQSTFDESPSPDQIQSGKELFETFSESYRSTICSTRGVMGVLLKGVVNTDELPVIIASHLLVNHFSEDPVWNEFASLFAALLHKTGVEEFCSQ